MAAETTTLTTANRVEPTYSVWEAAVLLGRSYSWLDQRVRNDRERLAHFRRPKSVGIPTEHPAAERPDEEVDREDASGVQQLRCLIPDGKNTLAK